MKKYNCYSVFYPVGDGRFNIGKSFEDINFIIEKLSNARLKLAFLVV